MIQEIPETDSIRELAEFWDTHDLADFEGQLEEVREPVFRRKAEVRVQLEQKQMRDTAAQQARKIQGDRRYGLDSRMDS
jgi:hypothetical protein